MFSKESYLLWGQRDSTAYLASDMADLGSIPNIPYDPPSLPSRLPTPLPSTAGCGPQIKKKIENKGR